MAYGDGEAPAAVVEHIEGCSACAEQVGAYVHLQGGLRQSLYRFDCPDAHTLGEYHLDLLEPEQRLRVAGHAVECEACGVELQMLRSYLAMPTSIAESPLQVARRLVATLFRPAPGLAYGGLRGTADITTRVFQVEDVTLTIGPGHRPGTLVGLVVAAGIQPPALDGREVRLLPADQAALSSPMDDLGNFEFEHVPAGTYALEINLPDALVVVEELHFD
jgi:hypothetical protein